MSKPTQILFIGNSFTRRNDMPGMLVRLAAAARPKRLVEFDQIIANGMPLKAHWTRGHARQSIATGTWNYVVLQEQSTLPLKNRARMHENITLFADEIKQAGARPLLYMTWARLSAQDRQDELSDAYLSIARELNLLVAPVGQAWQAAFKSIKGLTLHDKDGSHPNPLGSYLAACVFFATLFDQSPAGLPADALLGDKFNPDHIEPLQAIAWNTVATLQPR